RIWPTEPFDCGIVIGAMLEQKRARVLKSRHRLFSREAADMLDNAGEIDPAISSGIERLVDFLRVLAERRRSSCGLGRILRQREILDHQGRGKTWLVIVVLRRSRHRS